MDACKQCGELNPSVAVFCVACGRALWSEERSKNAQPEAALATLTDQEFLRANDATLTDQKVLRADNLSDQNGNQEQNPSSSGEFLWLNESAMPRLENDDLLTGSTSHGLLGSDLNDLPPLAEFARESDFSLEDSTDELDDEDGSVSDLSINDVMFASDSMEIQGPADSADHDDLFFPDNGNGNDLLVSAADASTVHLEGIEEPPADQQSVLIQLEELDDSPALAFTGDAALESLADNDDHHSQIEDLSDEEWSDAELNDDEWGDMAVTLDSADDLRAVQELREAVNSLAPRAIPPKVAVPAVPPPVPQVERVKFVLSPVSEGRSHLPVKMLDGEPWTVGKESRDSFLKDDPYLSPRHALFGDQSDRPYVRDLDSESGVWWRLRGAVPLEDGDEFMVGGQVLRFEADPKLKNKEDASAESKEEQASKNDHPKVRRYGCDEGTGARIIQLDSDGNSRNCYCFPSADETSLISCRIGRHMGDFVFPEDKWMSGTHALVSCSEGNVTLRDLGSFNGTWIRVHGKRLLSLGDTVLIGKTLWRIGRAV